MVNSEYKIILDFHAMSSPTILNVKRGDTGRKVHIVLVDGGRPYHISEDCYAIFTAKKPDDNIVVNPCKIDRNTIIYELTPQTVSAEGVVECEVKLYGSDEKLITSAAFGLLVNKPVYNEGDEIESENETVALSQLIGELRDVRLGYHGEQYGSAGEAVRAQVSSIQRGLFAKMPGRNLIEYINISGVIEAETGADYNSSTVDPIYSRSDYIPVGKGEVIMYDGLRCPTSFALIALYDQDKTVISVLKGAGPTIGRQGTLTMPQDGYMRLSSSLSSLPDSNVELITQKNELNILVLGNSFSQDSFAYLPPVLNELLPDYNITYGVAYSSGAGMKNHLEFHTSSTPYTWWNYWDCTMKAWKRTANSVTLADIMALKNWNIVYAQPNGSVAEVDKNVITPGRELLRLLQELNGGQFAFMMGQWLATSEDYGDNGETVFHMLVNVMKTIKKQIGIYDYIPIGTAIQNARTNADLQALGKVGNMLYDNHMQSGIAPLIATYTIALKILDYVGEAKRGIYGSTFEPTTENCIAINAYKAEGMVRPMPMTHGESQGVTVENMKAAQEYAVLAVNNPTIISNGITSDSEDKVETRLESLEDAVADLLYDEIDITSLTITPSVAEMGDTVNSVNLKWAINKDPVTLTVDGTNCPVDLRELNLPGIALTETRNFVVSATDERGATDSMTKTLPFYNGVYYGVLADGAEVDSAAILTLTRKLQNSRSVTFTATADATKRFAYAIPTRYGTPTFKDADTTFGADFTKLPEPVKFTNNSGYTENYDVWLSTYIIPKTKTFSVS